MRRLACLILLVSLTGCQFAVRGLSFRQDDRVAIIEPAERETVKLPVRVRWEARDLDDVTYAVFADRAPMPPGRTVEHLAAGDPLCLRDPLCPNEAWLAERGVWLISRTSLVIDALRDLRPRGRPNAPDRHELTVVILDGEGRRVGETGDSVAFQVDRGGRGG